MKTLSVNHLVIDNRGFVTFASNKKITPIKSVVFYSGVLDEIVIFHVDGWSKRIYIETLGIILPTGYNKLSQIPSVNKGKIIKLGDL